MNLHEMIHNAWENALVDAAAQSPQDDLTQVQGNYVSVQTELQAGNQPAPAWMPYSTIRCTWYPCR